MNKLLTAVVLPLLAANAGAPALPPGTANATNRFTITGMHCQGCANGLASELRRVAGVAAATVTLTNRLAVVSFDTNRTSARRLIAVIEEAGYAAQPHRP